MRHSLILHPDNRCDALGAIEVELVRRTARRLSVRFDLSGAVRHVAFPGMTERSERRDELWKTTCFELFLRAGDRSGYLEFNFSPLTHWAAYRFADVREGMENVPDFPAPRVDALIEYKPSRAYVSAEIDLERMAWLPVDEPWHIGLSAVIEERNGRKSYWALAHSPGEPDFHDPACFTAQLPAIAKS